MILDTKSVHLICLVVVIQQIQIIGIIIWMYEKLIFCEKYNLSLTELVSQEYVATYEEGFNYETIDGRLSKHLISVLEFRFTHKKDALYFKMNWS
jgi:hypothetical protein